MPLPVLGSGTVSPLRQELADDRHVYKVKTSTNGFFLGCLPLIVFRFWPPGPHSRCLEARNEANERKMKEELERLSTQMKEGEQRLTALISSVSADVKAASAEIKAVSAETKAEIKAVSAEIKAETRADINKLSTKIDDVTNKLIPLYVFLAVLHVPLLCVQDEGE